MATTNSTLPTVSSLWIGEALGWLDQLGLASFTKQGHPVKIYSYAPIKNVPDGVQISDARDIYIPSQNLLSDTGPAYIADLFRIHLMSKTDEIWIDTDLICLKPLVIPNHGFLAGGTVDALEINNAVMRLPKDSDTLSLMENALNESGFIPPWLSPRHRNALQNMAPEDRIIHQYKMKRIVMGPRALTWCIGESGKRDLCQPPSVFYPVPWPLADLPFNPYGGLDGWVKPDTVTVHLWSSLIRKQHKNKPPHPDSFIGLHMKACGIKHPKQTEHTINTDTKKKNPSQHKPLPKPTDQAARKIHIRHRQYHEFLSAARSGKRQLSAEVIQAFDGVVQDGPMAGFRMIPDASWGSDGAAKILGTYEQQLFEHLTGYQNAVFVDVGAADGFWAVGLVKAGHFSKTICFESRERGRRVIAETAAFNNVSDKVVVHGEANDNFAEILSRETPKNATQVILIDIEGAEYNLLTSDILAHLNNSTIIVELHPWMADTSQPDEHLIQNASKHFDIQIITDTNKNLDAITNRFNISDQLRYLLVSEQRRYPQEWLILSPKTKA